MPCDWGVKADMVLFAGNTAITLHLRCYIIQIFKRSIRCDASIPLNVLKHMVLMPTDALHSHSSIIRSMLEKALLNELLYVIN